MKNNAIRLLLTLLITHFFVQLHAQTNAGNAQKYLVFTFEVHGPMLKAKQYYYWMMPVDSLKINHVFELFPLYTDSYSNDNLKRCIDGKPIDIFTFSTATNFNFDNSYDAGIKQLTSLITTNRVKIQSFRKKWIDSEGRHEEVNVYVTPITGEFCHCLQIHGKAAGGFKGLVYLPVASFSYDKDFWDNKLEALVKYLDYSYIAYSSHYPSYIHGHANIRVKGSIEVF